MRFSALLLLSLALLVGSHQLTGCGVMASEETFTETAGEESSPFAFDANLFDQAHSVEALISRSLTVIAEYFADEDANMGVVRGPAKPLLNVLNDWNSVTDTLEADESSLESQRGLACHRLVAALRKYHNADNVQARSYIEYVQMHYGKLLSDGTDEFARFANRMIERLEARISADSVEFGPLKSGRRERIRRLVEATTDPNEGKPLQAGKWERVAEFTVGDKSKPQHVRVR
eukprot:CAMPEP_0177660914 /NCGR_PEP_ID=MMETSP0447-20121125/18341_1 /TAXON_ID=0 /ORGANISM="Stygamoeba regulata, Strain BSH-02190019" /LENGTH=231 /DNA_ID=CAMNT_0019166105 /DNA_START=101 /DNA_END=796 /DNA_ORIENTATION=-